MRPSGVSVVVLGGVRGLGGLVADLVVGGALKNFKKVWWFLKNRVII